jgi:pimeloyl-ACP methyl ester carboxylesterase
VPHRLQCRPFDEPRFAARLATLCAMAGLLAGAARGGEVELANGLVLEGTPVPIPGLTSTAQRPNRGPTNVTPMLMVDAGFKRYVFSSAPRITKRIDRSVDLGADVTFTIPHKRIAGNLAITTLGAVLDRTAFSEYGRRTVTLQGVREPIIQGIQEITPKQITVEGLNVVWEHGMATTDVDPEILDPILRRLTDPDDPTDRMKIALFYMQAGRYPECDRELAAIRERFPELADRVDEIALQLRQFWAQKLLAEIDQRRRAGQHRLAYLAAKQFPTARMSATVVRQVDQIVAEYDEAQERGHRAIELLASLQSDLDGDPRVELVAPLRTSVKRELDYESLPRLKAFLDLADDEQLRPDEKLALAYSGWVVGNVNASTDLDAAIRLWDARFLLGEFLRSDDQRYREETLAKLLATEGVDIPRLQQLVDELPPVLDGSQVRAGVPTRVVVRPGSETRSEIAYWVLLPTEYNANHRYPLITTLHPAELNAVAALEWWGVQRTFKGGPAEAGQSQRRGYVVIAPEYLAANETYDYGSATHDLVVEAILDARRRFRIDSDRVFLAGHGEGGNAAFDLGTSRPDLFAGVIPIAGISDKYTPWYWQNAKHVPMFVVNGELDRDTVSRNARDLTRMIMRYHDVVYCEYVGRGYESFFSEIHVLFDWMDLHRRTRFPGELDLRVLRPTDNRFYWIDTYGLPPKTEEANATLLAGGKGTIGPMTLAAEFTEANSLTITKSGARTHVVWLSPELVDFEERFSVRKLGRQKFNDFLSPSAETMLEDLRLRGDREKMYTVRLVID